MRYSILLLSATLFTASAQTLSFGIKGGVPLGEATQTSYFGFQGLSYVDTGRWTVGPTAELRLPFQFSIEVDALFRSYRQGSASTYRLAPELQPVFTVGKQDVKVWDIPLLLKYRFPGQKMRPFITAGGAFSRFTSDFTYSQFCSEPGTCYPSNSSGWTGGTSTNTRWQQGYAVGFGAEYSVKRIKIAPELRYTRLGSPNRNQLSLLVGVTF